MTKFFCVDLFLVDEEIKEYIDDCWMGEDVPGSDHVPIFLQLKKWN